MIFSRNIGIMDFFVDAKDEKARKYYEQFGFIPMPDNKQQLFLAMNGYNRRIKQFPKERLAHCIDCLPLNQNLKLLGRSIILRITKFL